jgi:hypothetical protein
VQGEAKGREWQKAPLDVGVARADLHRATRPGRQDYPPFRLRQQTGSKRPRWTLGTMRRPRLAP